MTTETRTTSKDTRRGFPGVACLECGEADTVCVNLEDLGFACSSCDAEFKASDVREIMTAWTRVLEWIELAPQTK
jgi:hypothetical protein